MLSIDSSEFGLPYDLANTLENPLGRRYFVVYITHY